MSAGIFGVARILEFHEGETWRSLRHPNVAQLPEFAEWLFDFALGRSGF